MNAYAGPVGHLAHGLDPRSAAQTTSRTKGLSLIFTQYVFQHDQLDAAAVAAAAGMRALADQMTDGRPVPAPTISEVCTSLMKVLDDAARLVTEAPAGLRQSLQDPAITVHDVDAFTGEVRDPEESVHLAADALLTAARKLRQAVALLDEARTELDGQGYKLAPMSLVGTPR